ncbi:MAG: MBL fold metallo-hydrolase [Candidatus Bathyarchaeota archaeon]|nr:MAG: MBL fold metallo-hydrolase [Candidatus Bathyarchaeota archaeon]
MSPKIFPISLGFNDCYLIQDDGIIMVDGGAPGKIDEFKASLTRLGFKPSDIELIIVTHGHIDHIGSLKDIKEFTGAKVAIHRLDKDCVEKGEWVDSHKPKGVGRWGRMLGKIGVPLIMWLYPEAPATEVDLIIEDEGLSLIDLGVSGRVVYTPGHTIGSLSVALDSGEVFVGDLAMNKFPLRRRPGLPVLVDDLRKVRESWKQLLELGVEKVYPGHGQPFSIEVIKKAIANEMD